NDWALIERPGSITPQLLRRFIINASQKNDTALKTLPNIPASHILNLWAFVQACLCIQNDKNGLYSSFLDRSVNWRKELLVTFAGRENNFHSPLAVPALSLSGACP
ncbi:MAG: hypothetical protein ACW7DW_17700, partial [Paraglaciecola chathamensis]